MTDTITRSLSNIVNNLFPGESYPFLFKVVIIGTCSGKTTFVTLYNEKKTNDIKPTVGTDITISATKEVYSTPVLLNIWDTGSHHYFGERNWERVFKYAHGIIYMCNDYDYEYFGREYGPIINNRISDSIPSVLVVSSSASSSSTSMSSTSASSNQISSTNREQHQHQQQPIEQLATYLHTNRIFTLNKEEKDVQNIMHYLIGQMLEKYILNYFSASEKKQKRSSNSSFASSFTSSLASSLSSSIRSAKQLPSDISITKNIPNTTNREACYLM